MKANGSGPMTYFHAERMPVLPARRREAARRQLEDLVRRSPRPRRRVRPGLAAAGAVAVVLSTGAAAVAVVAYRPVTNRTQARCYTVASLPSADFTTVLAPGRPGSSGQVRQAVAVCSALFRQGYLRLGRPGMSRDPARRPGRRVPALVACTMPDGEAAILPGGPGACVRAGLAVAQTGRPPS